MTKPEAISGHGRAAGLVESSNRPIVGHDRKGRPVRTFQNKAGTWGLSYQDAKTGEWKMSQYGRTHRTEELAIADLVAYGGTVSSA